jgi:uncharacterized phage protein (TIGR01671 family)
MKREILFRGKSPQINKWVYGEFTTFEIQSDLYEEPLTRHMINFTAVIPDTIGQFTGLYDIRGNRIFEDDIVYVPKNDWKYTVEFMTGRYIMVREDVNNYCLEFEDVEYDGGVRIIGNTHDNPELLKS